MSSFRLLVLLPLLAYGCTPSSEPRSFDDDGGTAAKADDPTETRRQLRVCFGWQYDPWLDASLPDMHRESFDCFHRSRRSGDEITRGVVKRCCDEYGALCDVDVLTHVYTTPHNFPLEHDPWNDVRDLSCGDWFEPSVHAIVYTNQGVASHSGPASGVTTVGGFYYNADCEEPTDVVAHELGHVGDYRPDPLQRHPTHQPDMHSNLPDHPMNPDSRSTNPDPDAIYCAALERIVEEQRVANPPYLDDEGQLTPGR